MIAGLLIVDLTMDLIGGWSFAVLSDGRRCEIALFQEGDRLSDEAREAQRLYDEKEPLDDATVARLGFH